MWIYRLKLYKNLIFYEQIISQMLFQNERKQQSFSILREEIAPCTRQDRCDFGSIDGKNFVSVCNK